jgi:hypothetical protein
MQRLHLGDPTCGWLGDDTLDLRLAIPVDHKGNPTKGRPTYEIWGRTTEGQQYICLRWPTADASLLKALAERDTRRGHSLDKTIKAIEDAESARLKDEQARFEAFAEKAQWAIRRDLGEVKRVHTAPRKVG